MKEEAQLAIPEIELKGQVIIIYSRDEDEPECISNFSIILKGEWSMGLEGK